VADTLVLSRPAVLKGLLFFGFLIKESCPNSSGENLAVFSVKDKKSARGWQAYLFEQEITAGEPHYGKLIDQIVCVRERLVRRGGYGAWVFSGQALHPYAQTRSPERAVPGFDRI